MSCPGACDGWLVIEWTPKAYRGGQYIWIGVKPVRPISAEDGVALETVGDPIPIRGTPIFFSVVPGEDLFVVLTSNIQKYHFAMMRFHLLSSYENMHQIRVRSQFLVIFNACV